MKVLRNLKINRSQTDNFEMIRHRVKILSNIRISKSLFNRILPVLLLLLLEASGVMVMAQSITYKYNNVQIGGGGFVSGIITSKTEQNLIYARTDVGGAYRWDAANNVWIPLTDWVSDSETGYLGVESLASDPATPANVYLLVGISYFNNGKTAILRSNDYGKTFSITDVSSQFKENGNGMGRNSGEKLVVDPNKGSILFCGTRANGLFKSSDFGASWSQDVAFTVTTTTNGNGISFVVFDPSTGTSNSATQTMIVGVSRMGATNLYRSDDGGATFTAITGAITNLMPQRAVLASDRNLYITYANGAGPYGTTAEPMDVGQIWKYNMQSGLWTNITPSGFSRAFSGISVDPNNANRVVASSINTYYTQGTSDGDRFFLSTNGGTSWVDVVNRGFTYDPNGISWNTFGKIHWAGSIEFDPFNTKKVYVTSGNGLFMTEDIDVTPGVWKFVPKGLEETVPLDLISIPKGPVVSVIGDYDGFRHTDVAQFGPGLTPTMGTTNGIAYAALNPKVVVRAGSKMYYSIDTAKSWTQCTINGSQGYVAISADGSTFLHSPGGSSTTYLSTNKGSSWSSVSGLGYSDARTVADPVNSNKFYAYKTNSGVMMISTNGGSSFSTAGSPGSWGSKHIRTVPGYEGHIWVALYNGGLTRSINSGQSFTKISNVSKCSAVGIGKAAAGASYPTLYIWGTVSNTVGIYRSTDEGTTWARINDDDHEYGGPGNGQFVIGDMNVFGRFYMSTAGRGVIYGTPLYDCNNDLNGTANVDDCSVCCGGNTGIIPCIKDCNGDKDGTAFLDSCKICSGGKTGRTPVTDKSKCSTSTTYLQKASTISCTPNPFSSVFLIKSENYFEYGLFNMVGTRLLEGKCDGDCSLGENLLPGVYALVVKVGHTYQTIKIVKE